MNSTPAALERSDQLSRCLGKLFGRPPQVRREVLDGAPGEFPRIDDRRAGLKYRYGYRISPLGRPQNSEEIVVQDLVAGMRRVFQPGLLAGRGGFRAGRARCAGG
jgi:carotenoid cleavage dioxygenase-like enzyme